jgi:RNA polymerase sigma-70 factor, ECF subfamily
MPAEEVAQDFTARTDPYRRELLAHCYRMLGSMHDAEDLVQETYLRAWRGYPAFEGRSSVRTWLYTIATRACLNALASRDRRVLPAGLGPAATDPDAPLSPRLDGVAWLEPLPGAILDHPADPAAIVGLRERTRLAFVAAAQHLPARQRAALLLQDVLGWPAAEVADLLGTSVAATNSALQRARAGLARAGLREDEVDYRGAVEARLLDRFVTAFEHADVDGLARLLRVDVELEMPPIPTWFAGRRAVLGFFAGRALAGPGRRVLPLSANGYPAAATYVRTPAGYEQHSIQVLEVAGGRIARIYAFLDLSLFGRFGLPSTLPELATA